MRKIGFLGGSFNPPHNGHIQLCLNVKRIMGLEKVILIPTKDHPFKPITVDETHRFAMCELYAKDHPDIEVSDVEIIREGISYSVDTFKTFKEIYPDDERYFICGSDIIYQLNLWRDFATLAKLVRFVCIKRIGNDDSNLLKCAENLNRSYNASIVIIEDHSPDFVSSTALRSDITANQKNLSESVYQYIERHALYDVNREH
jgi:nicotinate-nucleotide adenylyltransferase